MKSSASAVWEGGLKDGKGRVSAASGIFSDTPYTFAKRFEGQGSGTTPEELIAAAHSSCYAMALSGELGKAGFTPSRLAVKATAIVEPVDGKMTVHTIELELDATVPGIDDAKFQLAAENARKGCPISRLLNATINLEARLAVSA